MATPRTNGTANGTKGKASKTRPRPAPTAHATGTKPATPPGGAAQTVPLRLRGDDDGTRAELLAASLTWRAKSSRPDDQAAKVACVLFALHVALALDVDDPAVSPALRAQARRNLDEIETAARRTLTRDGRWAPTAVPTRASQAGEIRDAVDRALRAKADLTDVAGIIVSGVLDAARGNGTLGDAVSLPTTNPYLRPSTGERRPFDTMRANVAAAVRAVAERAPRGVPDAEALVVAGLVALGMTKAIARGLFDYESKRAVRQK